MAKKDFDCYSMCLWQLKDDSWGGVFVDTIDQEVEHRNHIKVVVQRPPMTATSTEIASPTTQSGVEPQVCGSFDHIATMLSWDVIGEVYWFDDVIVGHFD